MFWNLLLHPIQSFRFWQHWRFTKKRIMEKTDDVVSHQDAAYEGNPYAPGSWGVKYRYTNDKTFVDFYKLTPEERQAKRDAILDMPLTHDETLEELAEKLKLLFRK